VSVALFLDHNVRTAVAAGLRQRGVDVVTAYEDGSAKLDDEPLLHRANELRRVFFTHDDDFLAIADHWLTAKRPFSGVVYAHQYRLTVRQLIVELETIAKAADLDDMQDRVEFLPL
jgi:predicted nuclease of predicted toxin-antitoxin system